MTTVLVWAMITLAILYALDCIGIVLRERAFRKLPADKRTLSEIYRLAEDDRDVDLYVAWQTMRNEPITEKEGDDEDES